MKNPVIYSLVFVAIVAFASAETLIRPGSHVMFTALGNNANYQTFGTKTLSSKAFDFVFSAQANNDIHVAFMCDRNARTSEAYEIVIGGWRNTRSVIRKGTQGEEVAVSQGSRASCDSLEAYWVTYEHGQLSVYADTEESHLTSHKAAFLSAKLPQLSCDRLTVAFGAWNMPVHFTKVIYDKDEEYAPPNQNDQATLNSFVRALEASREKPRFTPENVIGQNVTDEGQSIIFTAADNQAHYALFGSKTLPRNDFQFQFSAQASNDVHVAMQCYQGARSDIAYEIVFGGWGNTRSVIRMGTQGKELASAKGPRTSANKLKAYWIAYEDGKLSVWEKSHDEDDEPFMSAEVDPLPCDRITVAFGAWNVPVHFTKAVYNADEEYKVPSAFDQEAMDKHIKQLEDARAAKQRAEHDAFAARTHQRQQEAMVALKAAQAAAALAAKRGRALDARAHAIDLSQVDRAAKAAKAAQLALDEAAAAKAAAAKAKRDAAAARAAAQAQKAAAKRAAVATSAAHTRAKGLVAKADKLEKFVDQLELAHAKSLAKAKAGALEAARRAKKRAVQAVAVAERREARHAEAHANFLLGRANVQKTAAAVEHAEDKAEHADKRQARAAVKAQKAQAAVAAVAGKAARVEKVYLKAKAVAAREKAAAQAAAAEANRIELAREKAIQASKEMIAKAAVLAKKAEAMEELYERAREKQKAAQKKHILASHVLVRITRVHKRVQARKAVLGRAAQDAVDALMARQAAAKDAAAAHAAALAKHEAAKVHVKKAEALADKLEEARDHAKEAAAAAKKKFARVARTDNIAAQATQALAEKKVAAAKRAEAAAAAASAATQMAQKLAAASTAAQAASKAAAAKSVAAAKAHAAAAEHHKERAAVAVAAHAAATKHIDAAHKLVENSDELVSKARRNARLADNSAGKAQAAADLVWKGMKVSRKEWDDAEVAKEKALVAYKEAVQAEEAALAVYAAAKKQSAFCTKRHAVAVKRVAAATDVYNTAKKHADAADKTDETAAAISEKLEVTKAKTAKRLKKAQDFLASIATPAEQKEK